MKAENPCTIIIAFGNLGVGGVQSKIVSLIERLVATYGKTVKIYLILRDRTSFTHELRLPRNEVSIHYRPGARFAMFHVPFSVYFFWTAMLFQPSVVLTFYDSLSTFAILISKCIYWKKIRVVLNEDTLPSAHTQNLFNRALIRFFYPLGDRIIVPTHMAQKDLMEHFAIPATKIRVIPNWTQMPLGSERGNKQFDLIYVGRFEPQKNLLFLLKAIRHLVRWKRKLTVCLIGEGTEKTKMLVYIRRYNLSKNVILKDSNHDISHYLDMSRIFVLCSHYEGMPVAVLEAMARGCPVVAMQYPGVAECIADHKTGYVTHSMTEFTEKIRFLITHTDQRNLMGDNARMAVKKYFSNQALQQFILEIIR